MYWTNAKNIVKAANVLDKCKKNIVEAANVLDKCKKT